jgi:hypothetical protein
MPAPILTEEVSAKGVTIYHRTGAHDDHFNLTTDPSGFQTGKDVFYGPGVYGSLFEKDMNTQEMVKKFGRVLIQSKVTSIEGFLIFQPQITKVVFGRELTIPEQLQRIFGKTQNWMRGQKTQFQSDEEDVANSAFSREMANLEAMIQEKGLAYAAQGLRTACPTIHGGLKGLITQDETYGPICVVHNKQDVVPLRYQIGTGDWKNAGGNKTFYLKVKEFYDMKRKTFSASEPRRIYPQGLHLDKAGASDLDIRYK